MEDILREALEIVKEASPHVWGVMMRQVYTQAYLGLIQSGLATMFLIAYIVIFIKTLAATKENDPFKDKSEIMVAVFSGWLFGGGVISFFLIIFTPVVFFSSISKLLNPEYYAIRYLIGWLQ